MRKNSGGSPESEQRVPASMSSSSTSSTQRRAAELAMEMESAGSSAKKVKLSPPVIHEAAPVPGPSVASDLKPTTAESGSQEPPSGDGEGSPGLDRISDLPDAVLGEIISLLSTKDGARTPALASRWRHLWRAAPLNLDFRGLPDDDAGVLSGVILSAHEGPVHRLCLPASLLQYGADVVEAWLQSPALDNLRELEFYLPRRNMSVPIPRAVLPTTVSRFSSTLRMATISQCHLSDDTVETLRFPQLRKLAMVSVRISEDSLHRIIATGCPGLECLLLRAIYGVRCLRINSPTLRSIGIRRSVAELIVEDAPSLERLLHLEITIEMQILVISAPKLEALGCISELYSYSRVVFGSTVIQGSISGAGAKNLWRRKHLNFLRSHEIHLRTVVMGYYQGTRAQVNLATFFVLNSRVLESIRLEVARRNYNEGFFADQHRMLQMDKRASRNARLYFTAVCRHNVEDILDVSDLDLTDPFACGC